MSKSFTPFASPLGSPIRCSLAKTPSKLLSQFDTLNLGFKTDLDIEFDDFSSGSSLNSKENRPSGKFSSQKADSHTAKETVKENVKETVEPKHHNEPKLHERNNGNNENHQYSSDDDQFGKENYNSSSPIRKSLIKPDYDFGSSLEKSQIISKLKLNLHQLSTILEFEYLNDLCQDDVSEDFSQIQLIIHYYKMLNKINCRAEKLNVVYFKSMLIIRNCLSLLNSYNDDDEF